MFRVSFIVGACLALALSGMAGAQFARAQESPVACATGITATDNTDSAYVWRVQAYQNLDCVIAVVETALKQAGSEEGTVSIAREDLEQIRTRAFYAKDAAARIGR